jgi:hypothetical protein
MATVFEVNHITEIARRQLRSSAYPAIRRVVCFYDEGVLMLFGTVPTYYQKQLAQVAVARFAEIERIANRIRVLNDREEP